MELSNIIKSDIVTDEWNGMWNDIGPLVKDLPVKPILIISNTFSSGSAEEMQLQKMLQACKLDSEQYNVVILTEGQKASWPQIQTALQPGKVLLTGVHPLQLGISAVFNLNEMNHFGGCVFIPTLSVGELDKQPDMKKQLWNNGLKPLFVDQL